MGAVMTLTPAAPSRSTYAEIADKAGVSKATVSRVLNGDERVHPDRTAAVMAAAEGLGYRPNRAARALSTGRTGLVAVVIDDEPTAPVLHYIHQDNNPNAREGVHAHHEQPDENDHRQRHYPRRQRRREWQQGAAMARWQRRRQQQWQWQLMHMCRNCSRRLTYAMKGILKRYLK